METRAVQMMNFEDCIRKINKVEAMLEELKETFFCFDKKLQESIERGEKDIKKGKVTICKTEADLNKFFASI